MSGYPQYNNGVPPQQPYVQFASPYPRPMTSNGAVPQQSQQPTNNNNNYIPTPANAMYGAEQGQGGARMRRQNTLSRPERSRSTRRPMMRDPNAAPPLARQGGYYMYYSMIVPRIYSNSYLFLHNRCDNSSSCWNRARRTSQRTLRLLGLLFPMHDILGRPLVSYQLR